MNDTLTTTAIEDRVPLLQKIIYGMGMLANQLFPAAIMIFMVVVVQSLGLNPFLWGVLYFIPRISDALTDPIMGFITDNTKSRWGRRRPYIFVGGVIAGLAFIAMWQLNPENSQLYNFTYFLCFSIIFYIGLTIFATPYVAMGYEMTPDFHERTRLMAVSQWVGQLAWVLAPWFWLFLYDKSLFPDEIGGATAGAKSLSLWVGLGCMLMAIMPAIFCKTQQVDPSTLQDLSLDNLKNNIRVFIKGFVQTFKSKPFMRLCIATFFVFNAFNTVAGFSWFIVVYYMNGGDTELAGNWPMWFGSLGAVATCVFAIPMVNLISARFGKKNAFLIAQGISIFGFSLFWWCYNPAYPLLMFVPLPFWAFGIGGLFTLMMSMTADVCDLDELNTGQRREGAFGAVYWWMVKFGFAIAGLGQGVILGLIGFDHSVQAQTQETLDGLRLSYIIVPIVGTLIAMWVMKGYDVTEERAREIRKQLDEQRAARS